MLLRALAALGVSGLAACGPEAPVRPALSFDSHPGSEHFGTVLATGLSAEARLEIEQGGGRRVFPVRVDGIEDAPAVHGDYAVEAEGVRFRPRFRFRAGLTYRAELAGAAELVFTMPERESTEPPRVEAIYPSSSDVPDNLLRLYVHFSRPMWVKDVPRRVHLFGPEGSEVSLPFVEIDSGLWDAEGRRLTLFFHPGRIKRGVGPNVALGPPLREGARYRLAVDSSLKDVRGFQLVEGLERELRVGPADRTSPDPARWRLTPPSSSTQAVSVDFDEPLDRALLLRFLHVEDAAGTPVAGEGVPENGETRWSFTPEVPWSKGDYQVVVDPEIEDLAGNTPLRLFDRDSEQGSRAPGVIRLGFTVR